MKTALLAALWLFASPAVAQEVTDCAWYGDMQFIAEPWEDNTRSFANGAVRLVVIELHERTGSPYRLAVISPPYIEDGWRQCVTVGRFAGIDFAALAADYDPARGLRFEIPVEIRVPDGYTVVRGLVIVVNQETGDVQAEIRTDPL